MAAAPQYGTMTFVGLRTRKTYTKDVYHSDVANALCNFDSGAGAGAATDTFWIPPEPVLLTDYTINTGMTDTTKIQLTKGGVPSGDILRFAERLNTLNKRGALQIGFGAFQKVGAIQLA